MMLMKMVTNGNHCLLDPMNCLLDTPLHFRLLIYRFSCFNLFLSHAFSSIDCLSFLREVSRGVHKLVDLCA